MGRCRIGEFINFDKTVVLYALGHSGIVELTILGAKSVAGSYWYGAWRSVDTARR